MTRFASLLVLLPGLAPLASCEPERAAADPVVPYRYVTMGADTVDITPLAERVATLTGYHGPESVLYDPEQDVFFISNIVGTGSGVDGDGYIVRLSAADYSRAEVFAGGGVSGGVSLDAPKGMALRGDVLWVADIDVLRGFDRGSGAPAGTISLEPHGAMMLNDIAVGPDGSLYVTDTGIVMAASGIQHTGGDRVFIVAPDGAVRVFTTAVPLPNGIAWDAERQRWVVASFNMFGAGVFGLDPATADTTRLGSGPGRFDGIELLENGRVLATSWSDESLYLLDGDRRLQIASGLLQPADLGFDSRRRRLLVPQVMLGHVAVFQIPSSAVLEARIPRPDPD